MFSDKLFIKFGQNDNYLPQKKTIPFQGLFHPVRIQQ